MAIDFDAAVMMRGVFAQQKKPTTAAEAGGSYTTPQGTVVWDADELFSKGWRGGEVTPTGWRDIEP